MLPDIVYRQDVGVAQGSDRAGLLLKAPQPFGVGSKGGGQHLDRNIAAANLDTRAQVVTKENVDKVGKRFEN